MTKLTREQLIIRLRGMRHRMNCATAAADMLEEDGRLLASLMNLPLSQVEMAEKAKQRPSNFAELSAEEQWAVDKRLGILDWDGT